MKNPATIALVVLIIFITTIVASYLLVKETMNLDIPNIEKQANKYVDEDTSEKNSRIVLYKKTDILGQAVLSKDEVFVGTLYDAYAHPQTGGIEWVSVNIKGNLEAPLVLLEANLLEPFGEGLFPVLKISKSEFMELEAQKNHEEELKNFISVRNLLESEIKDEPGEYLGKITRVTYKNGSIDGIIFELEFAPELARAYVQTFTIPFEGVVFKDTDGFYNRSALARLTQKQVDAIAVQLEQMQQ